MPNRNPDAAPRTVQANVYVHAFSLVLAGADAPSEGMADKLFEAGCDDSLLARTGGISTISFMREGPSLREAVVSAINNVRSANVGCDIVRVELDGAPAAQEQRLIEELNDLLDLHRLRTPIRDVESLWPRLGPAARLGTLDPNFPGFPQDEREILRLIAVEGKTFREAAEEVAASLQLHRKLKAENPMQNRLTACLVMLLPLLGRGLARADDAPGGLARKGFLGAQVRIVKAEDLKAQRVEGVDGDAVLVERVLPDSTAEAAGLRAGDALISINATRIASPPQLISAIAGYRSGQDLKIAFVREGRSGTASATLRPRPFETSDAYQVVYGSVTSRGKKLRTIVTQPKDGGGKHPALFLIQGLGSFSMEITSGGAGAYARIIDDFTRRGFVTMRVDKPGQGDSEGGPTRDIDFETELDGYRQALRALKQCASVDPENIVIFGHSMGGVMAPALAAETPVKGIAVYGTVAKTWHEYMLENTRRQMTLRGTGFAQIDQTLHQLAAIDRYVMQGLSPSEVADRHPELKERVADLYDEGLYHAGTHYEYFRQLGRKNLAEAWEKFAGQTLAAWGKADFVSGEEDHALIARIVNRAHPGRATFLALEGIDHGFSQAASQEDSFKNFRQPNRALNPVFFEALRDWAAKVCGAGAKASAPAGAAANVERP